MNYCFQFFVYLFVFWLFDTFSHVYTNKRSHKHTYRLRCSHISTKTASHGKNEHRISCMHWMYALTKTLPSDSLRCLLWMCVSVCFCQSSLASHIDVCVRNSNKTIILYFVYVFFLHQIIKVCKYSDSYPFTILLAFDSSVFDSIFGYFCCLKMIYRFCRSSQSRCVYVFVCCTPFLLFFSLLIFGWVGETELYWCTNQKQARSAGHQIEFFVLLFWFQINDFSFCVRIKWH